MRDLQAGQRFSRDNLRLTAADNSGRPVTMADQTAHNALLIDERRRQVTDVSNTTTKKPAAKPKAAKAKSKATKPTATQATTTAGKPAATPKAPKPLDPKVVALIKLLQSAKGATNEEAAKALGLKAKGKGAHQTPVAQVRAMIRDKVRKLHTVTAGDHDAERGGIVQRIK
jgi:hypothetical protein